MKIKYLEEKYTRKNAYQIRHYKQKINELKDAAMETISNEETKITEKKRREYQWPVEQYPIVLHLYI